MKKDSALLSSKWSIVIKATLLGLLGVGVSLVIFAAIMLIGADRSFAVPFATVSLAVGSLVSSYYAAYKIGNRGYLIGLLVGGIVFAIVTAVSLIVSDKGFTLNTLFHFIVVMLASLVGGVAGVNKKSSKKYI